jgi:outer membrane protein insertion porin family
LSYVKNVDFETTPVTGAPDLVDVNFKVEDGPSSQLSGGIGFSGVYHLSINGDYVDANVFGSGERAAIQASYGSYSKVLTLSQTNPYLTPDGVSRTLNLSYSDISRFTSASSEFSTKTYLAGIDFGYPVTEYQVVRLGASFQHVDLATITTASQQLQDWIGSNGTPYFNSFGSYVVSGTTYDTVEASLGWVYDSRNRTLFPTQGSLHNLTLAVTPPGLPVRYALAYFQYQQFLRVPVPILHAVPLSVSTRLGYGAGLGSTTALPPNRDFFIGGPDSVRGFREGTLGPRDSLGYPYGGNAMVSTQVEALLPMPAKFATSARASLFFDAGNAFYYGQVSFKDRNGSLINYHFSPQNLRTSAGVAVQWLAPLGLFRFSLAFPINRQSTTWRYYGDETEMFQFSIGNAF